MHKDAGRPWPKLSEDDVLDYMVMEAVFMRAAKEEVDAARAQQRKEFKKDRSNLDQFR